MAYIHINVATNIAAIHASWNKRSGVMVTSTHVGYHFRTPS